MLTLPTKNRVLTLPKPLPHQLPILLNPGRNKVVVCGRRWGKTALGLQATVRGHGAHRGARKGAIDGGKIWWVAPDYPTASEIWRDLKRATRPVWSHKDEVERRVELPTGGSVTVKSAHDPESLVAVGLDGLVIDEAAKVRSEAWHGSLRPTLSDRGGWAVFISTPKGFNWFHDLFQYAGTAPDWQRWQRPTSDNPLIPASELEAARRDSPRFFGQEYLARFESLEGTEFPAEYFPESIWYGERPRNFVQTALALDPSLGKGEKAKGCYASFAFAGLDNRGVVWVEAWMSQDWDAAQMVSRGCDLCYQLGPGAFAVETNGGQEFLIPLFQHEAKARGQPLPLYGIHNSENKESRIRAGLGPPLARGELRFRDTPQTRILVQQIRDFPVGDYMDGPDSLSMAIRMLWYLLGYQEGSGVPELIR